MIHSFVASVERVATEGSEAAKWAAFPFPARAFFPTICDGLSPAAICLAKLEKAIFFNDLL